MTAAVRKKDEKLAINLKCTISVLMTDAGLSRDFLSSYDIQTVSHAVYIVSQIASVDAVYTSVGSFSVHGDAAYAVSDRLRHPHLVEELAHGRRELQASLAAHVKRHLTLPPLLLRDVKLSYFGLRARAAVYEAHGHGAFLTAPRTGETAKHGSLLSHELRRGERAGRALRAETRALCSGILLHAGPSFEVGEQG